MKLASSIANFISRKLRTVDCIFIGLSLCYSDFYYISFSVNSSHINILLAYFVLKIFNCTAFVTM